MKARSLSLVPWIGALLVLLASAAEARPIQVLDIDQDVPLADVIVVAAVTGSKFKHPGWFSPQYDKERRTPTPAGKGYAVDFHDVTAKVLLPIKGGLANGATLTFRHRLESSTGQAMINGFMSHAFAVGSTYLLVLRKETDGVLAVPAPETWFYPTFPESSVGELPARPKKASDLDYVVRLLHARFDLGAAPDEVGIWTGAQLLESKAGLAYARSKPVGAGIRKRLEGVVDRDVGSDPHRRVLWMLHTLGHPVAPEKVAGWIRDPNISSSGRTNLVGELSVMPGKKRIQLLDRLATSVADEDVRSAVIRAADYARKQYARELELERQLREAAKNRK